MHSSCLHVLGEFTINNLHMFACMARENDTYVVCVCMYVRTYVRMYGESKRCHNLFRQNDEDSFSIKVAEIIIVNTQDVLTTNIFVSCESDTLSSFCLNNSTWK